MKKITITFAFTFIAVLAFCQVEDPASWSYQAKKTAENTYEITITAVIEHPWHLYSQNTEKGGPIPTQIKFKPNPLVVVKAGKPKEIGKLEKMKDENFGVMVSSFSGKVQFVQTVTVKGNVKTNIAGTVEYMVCNDNRCLPPTKKSFDLKLQ